MEVFGTMDRSLDGWGDGRGDELGAGVGRTMLSLMINIKLASRKSFDAYSKLLPVTSNK